MANGYRHIACCLDGCTVGDAALAAAMRVHALGDGRLTLVHVLEPDLAYAGVSTYAGLDDLDQCRTWMESVLALAPSAEGVLLEGSAPSATCEWAASNDVDLMVAVRHRGRAERILLGSFAQYLAHHAPCEVLLVKSPTRAG